jgi:hypothetical protein
VVIHPDARRADPAFSDYVESMTSSTAFDSRPDRPRINADLQDIAQQMQDEFADQLDPRDVDECFARVATKFNDAKVRSFVPLLVRRYVRDELQERLKSA